MVLRSDKLFHSAGLCRLFRGLPLTLAGLLAEKHGNFRKFEASFFPFADDQPAIMCPLAAGGVIPYD